MPYTDYSNVACVATDSEIYDYVELGAAPDALLRVYVLFDDAQEPIERTDRVSYSVHQKTNISVGRRVRRWQGWFWTGRNAPQPGFASLADLRTLYVARGLYYRDRFGNRDDAGAAIPVYWEGDWIVQWDEPNHEYGAVSMSLVEIL